MDGGFSQNDLPTDLTLPAHYPRLAEALSHANWSDQQIHHFAWNNWTQTLQKIGVTI
jgi:microsomal dipeptidase-like Zn-dependent dipeptidase